MSRLPAAVPSLHECFCRSAALPSIAGISQRPFTTAVMIVLHRSPRQLMAQVSLCSPRPSARDSQRAADDLQLLLQVRRLPESGRFPSPAITKWFGKSWN